MHTRVELEKKNKDELIEIIMEDNYKKGRNSNEVLEHLRKSIKDWNRENFVLVCLDNVNNILKCKLLFQGGYTASTVDIRIIFNEILTTKRCTGFIIAHNHPTGEILPSEKDEGVTHKIKKGAEVLNLLLLDHLILSRKNYFSFLEEGFLD